MILCLVTDRRRLGATQGEPAGRWPELVIAQARGAAAGRVDLIQVREPDLEGGALAELVRGVLTAVRGTKTRVIVNDRLDVALATGAHGVHLREGSVDVSAVRRLAPALCCGASVHDVEGVRRRAGASYLIAGTVLRTVSKAPDRLLGWEGLAAVSAAAASTPVLGIGGLGVGEMAALVASGAAGLAAIGAFIPSGPDDLSAFVQKRAENLRLAFDSAPGVT